MEGELASLQATGRLAGSEVEEEPSVELWLLLLLGQMEDYRHNTPRALEYMEKAIAHTPTCYDIY